MNRKLIFISLISNVILLSVVLLIFFKLGGVNYLSPTLNNATPSYDSNPVYIERTSLFENLEIQPNQIIFIGDSITERNEWSEMFGNPNIINRGVGSDTTEGVLNRLDRIVASKPAKIFLMIGINDLGNRVKISTITQNYSKIVNRIKTNSPDTKIYIQSVLPVSTNKVSNKDIFSLNEELKSLAMGYGAEYIDLYSLFIANGYLKDNLTVDGVHLKGEGYEIWKEAIERFIK